MKSLFRWTMIALSLQFGTVTVLATNAVAQSTTKKKAPAKGKKPAKKKPAEDSADPAAAEEGAGAAAKEEGGGKAAAAHESSGGGEYKAPYGMAGCGLGTLVFKENNKMQVLAATTNGTSASQTFGITTGTSNCKPSKDNATAEQKVFIEANLASLEKEASQGSGDHLLAFATLLGCDTESFGTDSQNNYRSLYSDLNPDGIMERYHNFYQERCERTHF